MAAIARRRVRVEMRPQGGKAIGSTGSPSGEEVDAAGSVIAVDSAPCEVLVGEGACWAIAVAAAGGSAEPCRSQRARRNRNEGGRQKFSVAGTAVDGVDGVRHTRDEFPRTSIKVVNPHTWPVRAKVTKIRRRERESSQNRIIGEGNQSTQANTGGR